MAREGQAHYLKAMIPHVKSIITATALIAGTAALAAPPQSILPTEPAVSTPIPPPPVVPTLITPPPAPVILPLLSAAQEAQVAAWLDRGGREGLAIGATRRERLSGEPLVRAALDRARALHSGRVDTGDFLSIWALRPALYDPLPGFADAVARDRLPQWIVAQTPPYTGYDGLRKGFARYQAIRDRGGWPHLAAGAPAAAIRKRLLVEDPDAGRDSLVDALQRAQRRYGLNPTGVLDANTIAALNVSVEDRLAAIVANMERWRWLPRELPTHRVQVNIAAAVLTVFEGDQPVKSMRAVTGRPGNETPMLTSSIHSIVVNPPWNVPSSIAAKELWPMGRAALLRKGYKIVGTPETGQRIVQPAGPGSALGRLKFDFDNPFAVYLHDTPSRGKFSSYDRLASHGCVRLEKPVELAQLMLETDPKWSAQAVEDAIAAGKTQRVALPQQVAVYLLYWTAFASSNGAMNFRADPYNWDRLLAAKVEAATRRAQTITTASRSE